MKIKNNSSGFTVIEVLLVILTLAIVGGAGYLVAQHINKKSSATNSGTVSTVSQNNSLTVLIVQLEKDTAQYTFLQKTSTSPISGTGPGFVAYSAPSDSKLLVAANDDAYLYLKGESDVSQSQLDTVTKTIANTLISNVFKFVENPPVKVKEPTIVNGFYNNANNGFYVSANSVCLMGSYKYQASPTSIGVDCVTNDSLDAVANKVSPLAAAYVAANSSAGSGYSNPYFGSPSKIASSGSQNYKYAEVGVATADDMVSPGATAYFYTDSSGSNWKYASESEEGLSCSALTTADAQAALGGICTNESP